MHDNRYVGPYVDHLQCGQDIFGNGLAGRVDDRTRKVCRTGAATASVCAVLHPHAHAGGAVQCAITGGCALPRVHQVFTPFSRLFYELYRVTRNSMVSLQLLRVVEAAVCPQAQNSRRRTAGCGNRTYGLVGWVLSNGSTASFASFDARKHEWYVPV